MADEFSECYGDLLTGSYDCVDRIVLSAYYPALTLVPAIRAVGSWPSGMPEG